MSKHVEMLARQAGNPRLFRSLRECYQVIDRAMQYEDPDTVKVNKKIGDACLILSCLMSNEGVSYAQLGRMRQTQLLQEKTRKFIEKDFKLTIDYGIKRGFKDIQEVYDKYFVGGGKDSLTKEALEEIVIIFEANFQYLYLAADMHLSTLGHEFKEAIKRRVPISG